MILKTALNAGNTKACFAEPTILAAQGKHPGHDDSVLLPIREPHVSKGSPGEPRATPCPCFLHKGRCQQPILSLSLPAQQCTLTSGRMDNVKCKFMWAVFYLLNTNKTKSGHSGCYTCPAFHCQQIFPVLLNSGI